jgi:hypothetical protein
MMLFETGGRGGTKRDNAGKLKAHGASLYPPVVPSGHPRSWQLMSARPWAQGPAAGGGIQIIRTDPPNTGQQSGGSAGSPENGSGIPLLCHC